MPKKNAFFYFMIDFKRREEAKGVKFANLGEVAPLAGTVWETMNASERQPYLKQAEAYSKSSNQQIIPNSKFDEPDKVEMQKQVIAERVRYAQAKNALDEEPFYLISLTHFGRTIQGVYIPAELGMVKFSLRHGVMDRMHFHINPGEIPLGAAYSVQTHTKNTHRLPLPPNALGLQNEVEIAIKFFRFFSLKDKMPVLYTNESSLPIVERMLHKMLENHTKHSELFLCPLSELFYRLREATEQYSKKNSPAPSVKSSEYILQTDTFAHTLGISCNYHEKEYNMVNCALSQAIRWSYVISKYCCPHMGIECIPGKHIPHPITNPLFGLVASEGLIERCQSGIASLTVNSECSRNATSEMLVDQEDPAEKRTVGETTHQKSNKKSSDETIRNAENEKQENPHGTRTVVKAETQQSSNETTTRPLVLLAKQDNSDEKPAFVEKATQTSDETIRSDTGLQVNRDNTDAKRVLVEAATQTSDETIRSDTGLLVEQDNPAEARAVVEPCPISMEPLRMREYSSYQRGRMSRQGHTRQPKYNYN